MRTADDFAKRREFVCRGSVGVSRIAGHMSSLHARMERQIYTISLGVGGREGGGAERRICM